MKSEQNEKIKGIFNGLKEGEPYQFYLRGNKLIIGVRAGYDENYDEYEIFECEKVKKIKEGLFKLKKPKVVLSTKNESEDNK